MKYTIEQLENFINELDFKIVALRKERDVCGRLISDILSVKKILGATGDDLLDPTIIELDNEILNSIEIPVEIKDMLK